MHYLKTKKQLLNLEHVCTINTVIFRDMHFVNIKTIDDMFTVQVYPEHYNVILDIITNLISENKNIVDITKYEI